MNPQNKTIRQHPFVNHLAQNHMLYMIGFMLGGAGILAYADQSLPNFEKDQARLKGSLLELVGDLHSSAQVISPNGGESYSLGETISIEWESGQDSASLYLIRQEKDSKAEILSKKARGLHLDWEIPETLPEGSYAIGLKSGGELDRSDGYFMLKKESKNQIEARKELQAEPKEIRKLAPEDLKSSHGSRDRDFKVKEEKNHHEATFGDVQASSKFLKKTTEETSKSKLKAESHRQESFHH